MESTLIDKARSFQQKGDFTNAEIYFRQTLEDPSLAADGHGELGSLLLSQGNIHEAVEHWKKSLELDENHFESLSNLGYMLSQAQDFNNALGYLEKAFELAPERDDIIMQIAQLKCQLGNSTAAAKDLESVIKKKSNNENVYLLLAQIRVLDNDFDSAVSSLRQLLSIKPNLPEALINLAQIAEGRGQTAEAEKNYKLAVEKTPFHFQGNMEYGRFLSNIGKLTEGLEYLTKAAQAQPRDWTIHVHLGNAYQELGDFENAIKSYKKSLSINPNDLGVKQNLSRVLTRFVPPWHLKMLADHERNAAFEEAIKNRVQPGSTVLDIGTGSGILSMMAAKQGAVKVYTCEQSQYIAEAAIENIKKNGFAKEIKVFQSKSTQLTGEELEEKPEVVVAEIFDAGLLGEHAVPSFRHALSQLCKPNTKVIPQSAQVYGRLLHAEKLASVNPMKNISGLDLSAFDQFRVPDEYVTQSLSEITHEFCSEEFSMLEVDFQNLWDPIPMNQFRTAPIHTSITSNKPIHGVAFWFSLQLDDKTTLNSAPGRKDNHWGQAISFFNTPLEGKEGDTLKFTLCHNDIKIWIVEPQVLSQT